MAMFAMGLVCVVVPTPGQLVTHILGVRSSAKMIRINTRWVVARMEDVQSVGYVSVRYQVRNPVRIPVFSVYPKPSVSPTVPIARPDPASVRLLNL